MQIFNISIFFFSIILFLNQIKEKYEFNRILSLLVILLISYSVKNILYTYSEWFVVLLFIFSLIAINKKTFILSNYYTGYYPICKTKSTFSMYSNIFYIFNN